MDRLTATRVFVEVVERGSQTAAADALEMSRAMVSRYLGELETWVGARLLHRTTRKLSLTGAGEQLLGQCREMLAMAEAMQSVSRTDEAAPRGTLRIACSQSLAQAGVFAHVVQLDSAQPVRSLQRLRNIAHA